MKSPSSYAGDGVARDEVTKYAALEMESLSSCYNIGMKSLGRHTRNRSS